MAKLIYLCIFLLPFFSLSQKEYEVILHAENLSKFIKHPETKFKDSVVAANYIRNVQTEAIEKGFLLASIDSITYAQNKADVHLYIGEQFNEAVLRLTREQQKFIQRKARLSEKILSGIPFSPKEISNTLQKIHNAYTNNGFPFSNVQLDSVEFVGHSIKAKINVHSGPKYDWKKIHIKGDTAVGLKYLSSLMGISVGDPFNQSLLQQISNAIEQVPFIKETRPHEILFTRDGCELFVYVESVAISSLNGVVGLQPDATSGRLALTGDVNLKLLNVLKRGELLNIRWQSIRDQTQSLTSRLNYPFLFGTAFGLDGTFDLYKRDTSFLELNGTAGVQYFLNKGNFIKVFYQNISSSVLSGGVSNPSFSNLGSTQSNNYGLSFTTRRIDYLPNPSRGFRATTTATVGSRIAQRNDTVPPTKSSTYRGSIDLEWFIPLHRRHVLRIANFTEFYAADEIFENEVFRFGGLTAQRGFNEDELLATTRTSSAIEYRFLLDRNSHVFAFYDITWYENNSGGYYNDTPYGFGVGFSFRTNLGVFSISYALGKQFDSAIQLSSSKVHFGYIAYF